MSVSRTDYVILGYMFDYNVAPDYEEYEDYYAGSLLVSDIIFVADVMCSKYFIAGKCLALGDEYEGFGTDVVISEITENDKNAVKTEVGELLGMNQLDSPKLLIVTHFN